MHYVAAVAALPTLSPLDAKTIVGAIEVGPETKVERRDEEDPIQCRTCTGMGRIVGFWWAEMERIGMPCAWGIAVLDQTISYLQFDKRVSTCDMRDEELTYCAAAATPSSLI
jgi:hypothetical protein